METGDTGNAVVAEGGVDAAAMAEMEKASANPAPIVTDDKKGDSPEVKDDKKVIEDDAKKAEDDKKIKEAADEEDPLKDIPKKYIKADGTVDVKKLNEDRSFLGKKASEKLNGLPVSDPDAYDLAESIGDNADMVDPDGMAGFKVTAHKLGLTQEQAAGIMKLYVDHQVHSPVNFEVGQKKLAEAWGVKPGSAEFKENATRASDVFRTYADDDMDGNSFGFSDPNVVRLLSKIGLDAIEAKSTGKLGSSSTLRSPEEIYKDPNWFNDPKAGEELDAWRTRNIRK